MKQKDFGLPPEYQKQPEYFDAFNVSDDTDEKNRIIENILRKHRVHTVLDLTCGTGSQVFWLTKHGFKVIGSDFSPDLLKQARAKAERQNIDVDFIDGDMRTLQAGTFDAVITIFNAVGHLTKDDFKVAIKNIYDNLKDGGLYVFDIFNLDAMSDTVVQNLAMDVRKQVGDTTIHLVQNSTLDRATGQLTSVNDYTTQTGTDAPIHFTDAFTLQIYTAEELQGMFEELGFVVVDLYDMNGAAFIPETSLSILMVVQKQ